MRLITNGAQIATYSEGKGPPVIFLHGGPGDTHHYMKRMAKPLFSQFQCIFFDQRGTGGSPVVLRDARQFRLELLLEDLFAVRRSFSSEPAILVGHSWGAIYALYACMHSPELFAKAALLNMGPLDEEMGRLTNQALQSSLSASEQVEWSLLREQREKALIQLDVQNVQKVDRDLMRLRVKSWIFDSALHETFLEDYYTDPPPDREVNKWIWQSVNGRFTWDKLHKVPTQMWLCVGQNDSVPVMQAERAANILPNATLTVLPRCGHIPWFEHRDVFYAKLVSFLQGNCDPSD
ncbi:MAG: alpha/beta fold hydrolase [Bdellovibrionales bacterium]